MSTQAATLPGSIRLPFPGGYRRLGDLATQIRQTMLPDKTDERPYLALEHIDSGDIVARRQGTSAEVRSAKSVFRQGDVLYGKLRPYLDKAVLATFDGVASTELLVLRAKPDVDPHFLAFAMHSRRVQKHAIDTTAGVNHPRTSWENLRELDIYCPPLEEQQRIVKILSTIRWAHDAINKEFQASIALRTSLVRELFVTRGGGWPKVALRDVTKVLSGGTPPKADAGAWIGSVPWVSPKDMKSEFLTDTEDHISDAAALEHSTTVPAGSSLVAVRGMALAKGIPICFAEVPVAFNQDLKGVVPGPDIDGRFLFYAMQASKGTLGNQIGTSAHGTKRIGGEAIDQWQIALPSRTEQERVSQALDAIVRYSASVNQQTELLASTFMSALHQLMSASA